MLRNDNLENQRYSIAYFASPEYDTLLKWPLSLGRTEARKETLVCTDKDNNDRNLQIADDSNSGSGAANDHSVAGALSSHRVPTSGVSEEELQGEAEAEAEAEDPLSSVRYSEWRRLRIQRALATLKK